ncbi:hypothetical protein BX616_000461 [Lobosporangium transversale]|uniref:Structure-specific endonuclease subunit SLX4 n=1 Tax=Lobosporangium transversale TaxID=64571 RepID=A0A1Y2G898_9FUNG|nr:hypothetical protein BCR41DRAFT_239446 [Lobosporangium transversale]KAF9907333.1 hypothetical protein BX616_000461 [Lobosporangium transversale]ORY95999.1 hypothetical protein BCR41DRAFT_239446 [Lobosporangium transversale]|eukprot:XP_021875436.1 hypothetical protein BCR41DRAFT_239446 [Lobosporangium transversale]
MCANHTGIKSRRLPLSLKRPTSKKASVTTQGIIEQPVDINQSSSNDQANNIHATTTTTTVTAITISTPTQTSSNTQNASAEGVIVLDSDSGGESDQEMPDCVAAPPIIPGTTYSELNLITTQISGLQNASPAPSKSPWRPSSSKLTQESVSSSQGSDIGPELSDLQEYAPDSQCYSPTSTDHANQYAIVSDDPSGYTMHAQQSSRNSPNPFLADPEETPISPIINIPSILPNQEHKSPLLSTFESTYNNDTQPDQRSAGSSIDTQLIECSYDSAQSAEETLECMICGKLLAHLDRARIEYHINNCIDDKDIERQVLRSPDMASALPQKRTLNQGDIAGSEVDYLARVKKCPVCKQDWPSKGKAKANGRSIGQPKARQKVDHMKRCARAHKRTAASLIYQIRILKENYERSLILGLDVRSESTEENDEESEADTEASAKTASSRKRRGLTTSKVQVVSLADTADADFNSDAIITTVHTPTLSKPVKMSKVQQMEHDQQDDSLQMALALSMSMRSYGSEIAYGSNAESLLDPSITNNIWSMSPLVAEDGIRNGGKRRRQTTRDKLETTVLPFAEVQHLIQMNVHALLFPENEESGDHQAEGIAQSDHATNHGYISGENNQLKTPPWRPSRFTEATKVTEALSLSQSSRSDMISSPPDSLWNLSHLKDTHTVEHFDLLAAEQCNVSQHGESENKQNIALGSKSNFDREKYISRFMRRFLQRSNDSHSNSSISGTHSSIADNPEVICKSSGSHPGQTDDKFPSPLWSASRMNRISYRNQRKLSQEPFSEALRHEIVDHLETMCQQIQQAKLVAYEKILDSIKRHPVAAGLNTVELPESFSIEDEEDRGLDTEAEQIQYDTCSLPSSPLLRYSRPLGSISSSLVDNHRSLPDCDSLPNQDTYHVADISRCDAGLGEEGDMHDSIQNDQPVDKRICLQGNNKGEAQNEQILVHSLSNVSSKSSCIDITQSPAAAVTQPLDLELIFSPEKNFTMTNKHPTPSRRASSSSDIPPPLDFAELGFLDTTFLRTSPPSRKSGSDLLWAEPHMSKQRNDENEGVDKDGARYHWSGATTPKRKPRTQDRDSNGNNNGNEEELALKVPRRPSSASKIRSRLPMSLSQQDQQNVENRLTRNVLYGLPLLKTAAAVNIKNTGTSHDNDKDSDDAMDMENNMQTSQNRASPPLHPGKEIMATNNRGLRTPHRTRGRPRAPIPNSMVDPFVANVPAITAPAASKTPKRKKTAAVLRAEALAKQSARAVANIKAQKRMPDYKNMSIARLRLAATTFGLKTASKRLLIDQLTSIWQNINPNPSLNEDEFEDTEMEREEAIGLECDRIDLDNRVANDLEPSGSYQHQHLDNSRDYPSPILPPSMSVSSIPNTQRSPDTNMDSSQDYVVDQYFHKDVDVEAAASADIDNSSVRNTTVSVVTNLPPRRNDVGDEGTEVDEEDEPLKNNSRNTGLPKADLEPTTGSLLEHQIFEFLNKTAHFRKLFLTYKPLDLEQVWEGCQESDIQCTRQQLRQFMDRQGIVCIVPAHSTLGSWRKTRANKRKRVVK